jgi:hypothetical protein
MTRIPAFLFALLAVSSFARAKDDCVALKSIRTSHSALRQGTTMDVEINFRSGGECILDAITARDMNRSKYSLDVAASPDLTMQEIGFGFNQRAEDGFREFQMTLRVAVAPRSDVGIRQVPALFHFTAHRRDGNPVVQSVPFQLPIEIVPPTAAVTETDLLKPRPRPFSPVDIPLVPVRILQCLGEILQEGNCGS